MSRLFLQYLTFFFSSLYSYILTRKEPHCQAFFILIQKCLTILVNHNRFFTWYDSCSISLLCPERHEKRSHFGTNFAIIFWYGICRSGFGIRFAGEFGRFCGWERRTTLSTIYFTLISTQNLPSLFFQKFPCSYHIATLSNRIIPKNKAPIINFSLGVCAVWSKICLFSSFFSFFTLFFLFFIPNVVF